MRADFTEIDVLVDFGLLVVGRLGWPVVTRGTMLSASGGVIVES